MLINLVVSFLPYTLSAIMLNRNHNLTHLCLGYCGIGDNEILKVTEELCSHPSLQYLQLGGNKFRREIVPRLPDRVTVDWY